MKLKEVDFQSQYFKLYELSEGIYAAQIDTELFQGSNGGFFDLGGIIIMWDAFLYLDAGYDLYRAIVKITGREPNLVVLSHHHMDHIFGLFKIPAHIPILTGPGVVEQIKEIDLPRMEEWCAEPHKKLENLKGKLKDETDPVKILDIKTDIEFYEYFIKDNPIFRLPNMTFTGEIEFKGMKSRLILRNIGAPAHTKEDIIAIFPDQKICFLGDLGFSNVEEIPLETALQFFTTDPVKHADLLQELYDSDIEIFQSGHGKIDGPEMIKKNIDFIRNELVGKERGPPH